MRSRPVTETGASAVGPLSERKTVQETTPTFAGWYPHAAGGGTHYWDGSRWTGDTRPPRRTFAAESAHRGWGLGLTIFGGIGILTVPQQVTEAAAGGEGASNPFVYAALTIAFLALGIYLLRGRGPSTKAVEARLVAERDAMNRRYEDRQRRRKQSPATTPVVNLASPDRDAVAAAQVSALANPETAKALSNLHALLYSRIITDAEFAAAKNLLLGDLVAPDVYSQILKLQELHRSGVLGDDEFTDAKAKILGL